MSQAGGQGRPRADLPQRPFYYQCPACGYPANHLPPTEENRVILLTEPQVNSSWYHCCRVCPFPVTDCRGQRLHMPLPEGFIPAPRWETRTVPDWGPFADPSAPSGGGGGQNWNQEDLYDFEVDEHGWHPSQYHEPAYRNFVVNQWLGANNPRPPLPYPENRYYWPPNPTDYSSSQGGANSSQYHDCLNANSNGFRGGTSTPPPSIPGAPPILWDSDPSDDEYFTADEQFPEQDQDPLDREAALYVQQTRENFVRQLAQQERQHMEQQPRQQQQAQESRYLVWGQLGTAAHAPRQGFQNPRQSPAGQGPLAQRQTDADGSGQDSHEQHRR